MRDQCVLHGAHREQRAEEHHRGEQPPVPRRRLDGLAAFGAGRRRRPAPAGQTKRHDDGADDAGDEREPHPDRPEMGVDH